MSIKNWPGGRISSIPPTPSGPFQYSTASGVWTLDQVAYWRSQNQWPTAGNIPTDPFFENVTMLLHGDGTNGAQNNTFLDSSTNNFTITRNGNTTQGSFSPYGPNWSNFIGTANNNAVLFTELTLPSDFTIETWIYPTVQSSSGYSIVFSASSSAEQIMYYFTDGRIGCYFQNGANGVSSAGVLPMNAWSHVAVVRSGSTVKIYVNGVDTGVSISGTTTVTVGTIGGYTTGNNGYNVYGYISNARIGTTAVYTANFTPPTAPLSAITGTLLLTCQSNRFVDNSASARTITLVGTPSVQRFSPFQPTAAYSTATIGGSGYFDGSGDYLTTATATSAFSFGTGDFTIEFWINSTQTARCDPVGQDTAFSSSGWWGLIGNLSSSGQLQWFENANSRISATATNWNNGSWNHIAVTRSGNSVRMFVNGTQVGSTYTTSFTYGASNVGVIAGVLSDDKTTGPLTGYLSNLRIVKGTAVYTSAFTPPTAPVTAITNTSLLLNFTNGAIFDNAMMNDLETVGNAQISTSVVKYGTGSLYFDGSGDWMSTVNKPPINLAGDFTVEAWLYQAVSGTNSPQIALGSDTFQNGTFIIYINTNQNFGIYVNGSVTLGSTVATVATWHHVAMVRSGSTITGYLNGTSQFTITSFVTFSGPIELGATVFGGNRLFGNGYIDDLRITNGVARYTANFTPPTAAFPDI